MRFTKQKIPLGTIRTRRKFIWFPTSFRVEKTFERVTVWLETVTIHEERLTNASGRFWGHRYIE